MKENTEMITITKTEYQQLVMESEFLHCLEACGVDNWQGYSEARQMLEEEEQ